MRRRRRCEHCGYRFTTFERIDEVPLMVRKAGGGCEPFDRRKVIAGVQAAIKGRGIDDDRIQQLAEAVEDVVRLGGSEVTSAQVGVAVLDHLRMLDDVAYLRFASVYKDFDGAADFHREIELLAKHASADAAP